MEEDFRPRFTLRELFVTSTILCLLFALFAPSLTRPRGRSRLAACSLNLGQLARASANNAINRGGGFGGYLEPVRVLPNSTIPNEDPATPTHDLVVAWPTKLLPSLDFVVLYEQVLSSDKNFNLNAPPRVDVFLCPSDAQIDPDAGGLSYVVNSGMPDLLAASASQPSDLRANGVFHDLRPGRFGPKLRWQDIKDGASVTILFSENIHRDPPGSAKQPGNTWLRPAAGATNLEQWYGMVWVVDPQNPRSPRFQLMEPLGRDMRSESELDQPYAASGTRFARPASEHPDVFNVAFCEGNTRTISEDVDYAVYQQLMTPDGHKAAPANAPDQRFEKTLPNDQRFMNPPLNDSDY
jgi:Tfp pilus assembly protein FimT